VFKKGTGDVIHCAINGGSTDALRQNVYYLKYEGQWKNAAGSVQSTPIDSLSSNILVYNSGTEWVPLPVPASDSSNNPYIQFSIGHTADPVNGGAGTFTFKLARYVNGSWLITDVGITTDTYIDGYACEFCVRNNYIIDLYIITGGTAATEGGNIQWWMSVDSGASFKLVRTIITGQKGFTAVIKDFHINAKIVISNHGSTAGNALGYLYGDSGFILREYDTSYILDTKRTYDAYTTSISETQLVAAKYSNGIVFPGGTTYRRLTIGDADVFSFGNAGTDVPFSISFWIKAAATSGTQFIISKEGSPTYYEWRVAIATNKIQFACFKSDASAQIVATAPYTDTTNYNFICCTYDGSKTKEGMKIYINCVESQTVQTLTGTYNGMTNTTRVVYVGNFNTNQYELNAILDEIYVWNNVLTPTQMTDVMNNILVW
jgi:hypothetical protein